MEAIRYPGDFDGIVAGAPALDWIGITAKFMSDAKAVFGDPRDRAALLLPPETLKFVEGRILASLGHRMRLMDRQCSERTRNFASLESSWATFFRASRSAAAGQPDSNA